MTTQRHKRYRRCVQGPLAVRLFVAALGTSLGVAGCVAPAPKAGDVLPGVSVTAHGQDLALSWEKDALIVRALRPGALIEVVGEYQTANGRVTGDPVGSARVAAGANQLRFTLADSVRVAPTGPVCLRFRVDGRTALPLRAAGGAGATDAFQYPAWTSQVAGNSRRKALERERALLESSASSDREALASFDVWRSQRRLTAATDCERMTPSAQMKRPDSALDPAQHAVASQRECTYRLVKLLNIVRFPNPAPFLAQAESLYVGMLDEHRKKGLPDTTLVVVAATDNLRRIRGMKSVVQAQAPAVSAPFRPLLIDDPLALTSSTVETVRSAKGGFPAAAVPGVLDTWESCLADSTNQFQLSYETWRREQDPRLQASRVEVVRGECRSRFADAQRRSERSAQRDTRVQVINVELTKTAASADLPSGQSLSQQTCVAS